MFEKDIKEEAEKRCSKYFQENCYKENRWADTHDLVAMYLDGYNKANEWHYVKDGDLPKDRVQVLSEKGTLVIYKGDCFCWFEYSPNADNIKLRKWEEPIAWCEIPKYTKED